MNTEEIKEMFMQGIDCSQVLQKGIMIDYCPCIVEDVIEILENIL
mgnify:CR=1 FL=1